MSRELEARQLLARLEEHGTALESSALELDEEMGHGPVCEPWCHPLWPERPPDEDDEALSHWLAARLPLSTNLRAALLATLCPLRRMQDVVDAMRLLLDPLRARADSFKYKLVVNHAAHDSFCGTGLGGAQPAPRMVVALAPPTMVGAWAWNRDEQARPELWSDPTPPLG